MIEKRIELRELSTSAEVLLWEMLKSRQLNGMKFRRQHGVGQYVVDFYYGKSKSIIELDGDIHQLAIVAENDKQRQQYLEDLGYRFLRISNEEVFNDIDLVLQKIDLFINS